ncbi:Uncharacterised protein [Burkholderia pseudomallei]|nr:hypothetical protein DP59_4757 [Burkholderia pseudomallei]CAK0406540.1 Uncharacterised protein [Burkholderia pseudomallei]
MTLRFRKTRELVRLSISDSASQTVSWYTQSSPSLWPIWTPLMIAFTVCGCPRSVISRIETGMPSNTPGGRSRRVDTQVNRPRIPVIRPS